MTNLQQAATLANALRVVLTHGSLDPNHLHKFGTDYQQAKAALADWDRYQNKGNNVV